MRNSIFGVPQWLRIPICHIYIDSFNHTSSKSLKDIKKLLIKCAAAFKALGPVRVLPCSWFWGKRAAPKVPEWPSYGNFGKVTQNLHFLKKCKREDQGKFFKNRLKSSPRLKGPKSLWRKCHYPRISMHLKCKDWRRFQGKKAAAKVPKWPSYGNFCKVTQNPHFLKKCKGGTKENFSKIAQKTALT